MVILVFFMVISVNRRLFRYFGSYSGISVIPVILVNRRTPRMAGRFAGAFKHILKLNVQCSAGTFWFNTTYSQSPDCRLFLPNLCFI